MEGRENRRGISQEMLKSIACGAMLLDHGAAVFAGDGLWYLVLRGLGRLSFPIFCFLLCEGAAHTRSPKRYALRLLLGAVLAELPFDFAIFGELRWTSQSVMLTLLLGYGALLAARSGRLPVQLLALPLILLAELLGTDYGGYGAALICLMGVLREKPRGRWLQYGVIVLFCGTMPSIRIPVGGAGLSLELLGILSIVPICLYRGRKCSRSKPVQLAFYLFYPVHLLVLALLRAGV